MWKRAIQWSELNRDVWFDLFRIVIGFALFLKGVAVFKNAPQIAMELADKHVPFAGVALVDIAAFTHFVGGMLLVVGIVTRLGAAIQIPAVLGAIFFIHIGSGLVKMDQGLEIALVYLCCLVVFTFTGAGRISSEWYFSEHPRRRADGERRELNSLEHQNVKADGTRGPDPTRPSRTPHSSLKPAGKTA